MSVSRNKYCSNCLRTQRFLDLGAYLLCEHCGKRLERIVPLDRAPRGGRQIADRRPRIQAIRSKVV